MGEDLLVDADWIPASCTLPTADRPLRLAGFDELFKSDAIAVVASEEGVVLTLRPAPEVAARAAELAAVETQCCSFFGFDFTITAGRLEMIISVEPVHQDVLDALAARANSLIGTRQ